MQTATAPTAQPTNAPRAAARGGALAWVDLALAAALAGVALLVRWPYLWTIPRFTDETLEVLHSLAIVRDGARPLTNYDSYYGALYNYLVAFALVLVFVPRRKPVAAPQESGVLAGVRFLLADPFLGPVSALVVVTGFLGAALPAGLPVYAFEEFDGNARIAGVFLAALGAGALVGSVLAVGVVRRIAPLRLATVGLAGFTAALWALPFLPPWPVVLVCLFLAAACAPLVNGPVFGVLTKRTPPALRAKALTAVVAINSLAAPLGYVAAGQLLERWGVATLFACLVLGVTAVALLFTVIVARRGELADPLGEPARP
jgi:predicted MFS family arabinose efflux permease